MRLFNCGAVLALFGLLLGGCALHTPMSRTLTFHDVRTEPSHSQNFGIGFVRMGTLTSNQFLRKEARRRFGEPNATTDIDPYNLERNGPGGYISYYNEHEFAISLSLGAAVGADATWKVSGRNYATLSASFGGMEAFWSHRVMNTTYLGVAAGAGYRLYRFPFDVTNRLPGEEPSVSGPAPDEILPVHSGGGHVSVILRPGEEYPGPILGHLYVGYAPAYRRPVITFGVVAGIF